MTPVRSLLTVGPGGDVHRGDVQGVPPPTPRWSGPLPLEVLFRTPYLANPVLIWVKCKRVYVCSHFPGLTRSCCTAAVTWRLSCAKV